MINGISNYDRIMHPHHPDLIPGPIEVYGKYQDLYSQIYGRTNFYRLTRIQKITKVTFIFSFYRQSTIEKKTKTKLTSYC